METTNYNSEITFGDVMTVAEFKRYVASGFLRDYDGFGHPAKDGLMNTTIYIYPSEVHLLPDDATHVVWYNK